MVRHMNINNLPSSVDALNEDGIASVEQLGSLTLPTGEELTPRQNQAITLKALTTLSNREIAERCGYAGPSVVWNLVNSEAGQRAYRLRLTQHTLIAAKIGLDRTIKLAQHARSENVQQLAAAKLLDIARLDVGMDLGQPERAQGSTRDISISINLAPGTDMKDVTVEASKVAESEAKGDGGGGKTAGPVVGDPSTPDKTQTTEEAEDTHEWKDV